MLDQLTPMGGSLAELRYLDNDFQVVRPGSHVKCAITAALIELEELKYWSVARQEAYATIEASLKAELASRHHRQR
ncbi:DUF2093 domain-containing protein [Pararhizobium sp. IMCC21322]|uniref:DUF2093 domain-containing protein n=1 Tax=Pararhizobium sp. IMCC21322 TaxID=3067903 RepID=UPI0027416E0A|nr:DUF2093 domain-containing protein [Pararhizobium sp. IMCC21322]